MTDVHSKDVRSYNMSRIRSKDTKPELLVRKHLFAHGCRFRLHSKKLPGKPDIVLPKYKTVIFVHGCFWHGHTGCKYFVVPKTKTEWWLSKIQGNKSRDIQSITSLEQLKWKAVIVWECELKPDKRDKTLDTILRKVRNEK